MIPSEKSQRIILWWSIVLGLIFGNAFYWLLGMVPPPRPSLTPDEVAAFYTAHAFQIKIGAIISAWTSAYVVPFSTVLSFQIARLEGEKPVWAVLAFAGGTFSSIFLVLPPLIWGVAAFTPTRLPEITAAINELANLSLVTTTQFFIFQFVGLIYIGLKAKPDPNTAFPRWFCWVTLWLTLFVEAGAFGFMFKEGPFAWNGLFVFWLPFVLYFLWLIPAYYLMFRALRRQEAAKLAG